MKLLETAKKFLNVNTVGKSYSFLNTIFEYGVMFLIGRESGFLGTNCLECSRTNLKKGDRNIIESIKEGLKLKDSQLISDRPRLWYHSFPYNLDYHQKRTLETIRDFMKVLESDRTLQEHEVSYILDRSEVDLSETYCTYFFGDVAIGPAITVWWFSEEEIDNCTKIENETGMRVFPRYVYHHPLYESMSMFCWKYRLKAQFADIHRKEHPIFLAKTDEIPWKNNSDFLEILTTVPSVNQETKKETKTKNGPNYDEIIQSIWSDYNKGYGHDFLSENSPEFINRYIELARKVKFSHKEVWELKEDYLKCLHEHMRREALSKEQYAFYTEGPTWTIIFDGKIIRGLKGKGFQYIHYLVCHKGKLYTTDALSKAKIKDGLIGENKRIYIYDSELKESNNDQHEKADETYKADLEKRMKGLQQEINEAEENNDLGQKEKANDELESIIKEYDKLFGLRGQYREFRNKTIRTKDRITKNIERAVKEIKKYDAELASHFYRALKPINDFNQSYRPSDDIEWQTE